MSKKAPTTKTKVECQLWQSNKWLAEALKYIEQLRAENAELRAELAAIKAELADEVTDDHS